MERKPWRVLKFGGTSVATAEQLRAVATLAQSALMGRRVCVVVSAVAGITSRLQMATGACAKGEEPSTSVAAFAERHRTLARELGLAEAVIPQLEALESELARLLGGVTLLKECSPSILAQVLSLGERAAAALFEQVLLSTGVTVRCLDPREWLPAEGDPLEARVRLDALCAGFQDLKTDEDRLLLLPGFFAGDADGRVLLLGRGGSDYSAALVAMGLRAAELEIWTDVNGIYSADPRLVPEAFPLTEMSYEEAMELAHFGAKVLHPKTLAPLRTAGIPLWVRDSFHPEQPGTQVGSAAAPPASGVRGLSWMPGLALLNLSGSGMPGVPGVAARAFAALAQAQINVLLITQGSSEVSICIAVPEADGLRATEALRDAFRAERVAGLVDGVELRGGLGVLSVVGDGMHTRVGMAAMFTGGLADAGCNIIAMAQGGSERSISVVIESEDGPKALRSAHRRCLGTRESMELHLMGLGTVGGALLSLLARQIPEWREKGLDIQLRTVANSRKQLEDFGGMDPLQAAARLAAEGATPDLDALLRGIKSRRPELAVFVDCTSNEALSSRYLDCFEAGLHVVTANKKANSASMAAWRKLRQVSNSAWRRFLYETNVGAGLPVIDTVKGLRASGDRILRFEGILSGTLSFILGRLGEGIALSQAVKEAMDQGFAEPDPRDDLSGADVARKVLILAREMGLELEPEQVQLAGLLPADFDTSGPLDTFLARLPQLDEAFRERVEALKSQGRVLRYLGSVEPSGARAGLQEVEFSHPLAAIQGGENALSFLTAHYQPRPMVIRGYGAGAEVTAAGVLSDILRLASGMR